MKLTVTVPDLGGFKDVAVIDVLVKPGQAVDVETPLITVESDKATMDVPSTAAGTVENVVVKAGDKANTGSPVAVLLVASEGSIDLTAPRAVLRAPEPFGGEPYLDTVPMQPMPEAAPSLKSQAVATTPEAGNVLAGTEAPGRHGFEFDLVVLGAGPGGYTAAFRAADLGLRVALVDASRRSAASA